LVDFLSITNPRARRIATYHMIFNLGAVFLFAVNFWLRSTGVSGANLPVVLSAVTIVVLGISGWLGGELVYVHGMGVETSAPPTKQEIRRAG
jgi:uncharacterized membrane protein